jgi:type I restriction-modification system DNA methylase subunit
MPFESPTDDNINLLRDQPMLLMDEGSDPSDDARLLREAINPSRDAPGDARSLAARFATRWEYYQESEQRAYQRHFIELCEIVGYESPFDDLEDDNFVFQKFAPTPGDRRGIADVWLRGRFVMEYKRPLLNLENAYVQTLKYRDSLGNPPLLIVSDFRTIRIHTNFTGTVSDTYTITIDDLRDVETPAKRKSALGVVSKSQLSVYQVLWYCFNDPAYLKPQQNPDQLTQAAAEKFREISDELQKWNPGKDIDIARFLSQILFCMFASNMALLEKNVLTKMTREVGDEPEIVFPERLNRLFEAMSVGDRIAAPPIKRFNGGLFDGRRNDLRIEGSLMPLIREADAFDMSQIEPAIFGTLFERIYNPEKRAQHGRHYTSRQDIETLVEPVVMVPFRREWEMLRSELRSANSDLALPRLQEFIDKLGEVRILDPACGSGNFLYVALNLLHGLEREVASWALEFGIELPQLRVHPRQLLGIEIDEYAQQLASVVVWMGYIQNETRNGNIENRDPIIDPLENIYCRDAIIDNSGDDPRPADWPEADFIVGNPPFLGNKRMREEMGDEVVERIYQVWGDSVPNGADLCTYWFEKARIQIADGKAKRAGLLATQSIRGGRSREVLRNIKDTGDIFFGESDREWTLEGVNVRTSMVGFDDGTETERVLDGQSAERIHPDLTSRKVDLTRANRLRENSGIAFQGVIIVGPFDLSEQEAPLVISANNPDGVDNADVLKPLVTAKDITERPSNRWIIDFGVSTSEDEAARYQKPFQIVQERVIPYRLTAQSTDDLPWWRFASTRPNMRAALSGLSRYIATPLVSKHRVFVWLDSSIIANHSVGVFAREDDYFIGVLQSRVHEVWALAMGTQVRDRKSGFRYTHTTCFETFPLPEPTDEQREAIAEIAKTLMWHRKNVLTPREGAPEELIREMTLTNIYNDNHRWLQIDHEKLDRAVFAAYGWSEEPADVDDDTILERLLELNLSREPA